MEEIYQNKYYIKLDENNRIVDAWSDGPHSGRSTDGYVCFGEGGYQLRLKINGVETEENPPLFTMDGVPLYRWDGEQVVRRSEAEIAADRAALPDPAPSEQERLRADVDFLAAMQGVTL